MFKQPHKLNTPKAIQVSHHSQATTQTHTCLLDSSCVNPTLDIYLNSINMFRADPGSIWTPREYVCFQVTPTLGTSKHFYCIGKFV